MGGGFVVTPAQQKHLRACMVCSFVQLHSRFLSEGCPNCEPHLGMVGAPEVVEECTSPVYEGLISLVDPMNSWVAKWNRLEGFAPGVYAVKVVGMVSLLVPVYASVESRYRRRCAPWPRNPDRCSRANESLQLSDDRLMQLEENGVRYFP